MNMYFHAKNFFALLIALVTTMIGADAFAPAIFPDISYSTIRTQRGLASRRHDDIHFERHDDMDKGSTLHSLTEYLKKKKKLEEGNKDLLHFINNPPSPAQAFLAATKEESDDAPESLFGFLQAGNGSKNEKAKAITSVAVVDTTNLSKDDVFEQLKDIQLLSSFINAYASKRIFDARKGKGFNLNNPKEALDFAVQYANNVNLVITKSMAGFLNLGKVSTSTMNKSTTGLDINTDIIKFLFGSLSLPKNALMELEGLLKTTGGNLNASITKADQNLKHVILYYYFEPVEGLPDVKVAKMRFYFLSISKKSWAAKICFVRASSFNFDMTQVDTETEMNLEMVRENREKIKSIVETMCKKNLDEVNKAVAPKMIETN